MPYRIVAAQRQRRLIDLAEAASAAVASEPPLKENASEGAWNMFGGALLEAELRVDEKLGESPVRLIDARFLVKLAELGGTLVRRQDLPKAAFLSLEAVRRLRQARGTRNATGDVKVPGVSQKKKVLKESEIDMGRAGDVCDGLLAGESAASARACRLIEGDTQYRMGWRTSAGDVMQRRTQGPAKGRGGVAAKGPVRGGGPIARGRDYRGRGGRL